MFMTVLKSVILISAASLVLSSCVTANKCNDKFPTKELSIDSIYNKVDTIIVFKEVPIKLDPINFYSDWWDIRDLKDSAETILPKGGPLEKGQVSIKKDGPLIKVRCLTDSLNYVIDSLALNLSYNQLTISKLEQKYFDVKAENRKLKIVTKENVQNAKAGKNKALSKIFMWIFLSIALLTLAFSIFKFKKK